MPRVIEFENRRIEVPDDFTDADVSQVIAAPTAAPAEPVPLPTPRPPQPPSMTDTIMDGAQTAAYLPRGVRRGMANLAGLPVDAVNAGLGLVGLPTADKPFLGSRFIDEALGLPGKGVAAAVNAAGGNILAEPPPPSTFAQHLLSRTGEEVGAAAVPAGVALNTAKMGVDAARKLPALARMFVEPAAINPGTFARKEAGVAAAAGAGAGLANEITGETPGSALHNVADIGGALAGAGAYGLTSALGGPVKNIWGAVSGNPKAADRVIRDGVVDTIANAAGVPNTAGRDTSELAATIMRGKSIDNTIPGYTESLADRTKNPGVGALEYSRSSGPNSGQYAQRASDNNAAVDTAMDAVKPNGTPGALRDTLETERGAKLSEAGANADAARTAAEDAVANVKPIYTPQARGSVIRSGVDEALNRFVAETQAAHTAATRTADEAVARIVPQSDPAVRGNVVRSALEDSRDVARAKTSAAYDNADVNGRGVDPVELRRELDQVDNTLTATERGLVPQGTLDRVRALGEVTLPGKDSWDYTVARAQAEKEMMDTNARLHAKGEAQSSTPIEGRVNEILREKGAGTPDPVRLKEATDLRSELLRLQRAAVSDPHAEKGGRNAARVLGEYIDTVESFIHKSVTPDELNAIIAARGAKTAEADSFTRAGDPVSSVLARHEGGNPRVRDERVAGTFVNPSSEAPLQRLFTEADTPQVRSAISDEIVSKIPEAARGNPQALDRFIADYEIPLRQFPGLRGEIAAASAARRGAADAETAVTTRRQEFSGESRALADVSARRSDGSPALLDEQIPAPFANPAGNRDLDALLKRADTPAVRTAIEDELLGRASNSTDRAERIQRFIDDHTEPLKHFPGLQERLAKAATARTAEREATTAADTLGRDLGTADRAGTGTVGKYLQFGDERAQEALKGVIASKDPAKAADELLTFAKNDPKAVEGGRKAFWDLMQSKGKSNGETTKTLDGAQPWMPNRLKNFLDDPATSAVADRLYKDNPEHLARIREIADTLQDVNLRQRAKAPNTSGTGQAASILPTGETIASRVFAVERGVVSPAFAGLNILGIMARRATGNQQTAAFQRALDKALLDPDWAAALLKENNPANRAALAKGARGWMGNEADTLMKTISGDGSKTDDPTADAAMRKAN